jgi:hypothetical protein
MDVASSTPIIHKIQTTTEKMHSTTAATTATTTTTTAVNHRPAATSSDEALWQLMNFPHPLDILADPGAYGDAGSISRYHNPDNYTKAIGGVLRARGVSYKTVVSRAKASGITFRPPSLGSNNHASAAAEAPSSPSTARGSSAGGKMHLPLAVRRSPSFSTS